MTNTTDAQAIARGYTHKVTEGWEDLNMEDQITYFTSEEDAKAYQSTRRPGSTRERL